MKLQNILNEMPQAGKGNHSFGPGELGKLFSKNIKTDILWIRNKENQHYYFFEYGLYYYMAIEKSEDTIELIGYMKLEKYINLEKYYSNECFQVTENEIIGEFRNKGLSTFFYEQILLRTKKILVSDYIQYDGERNVWNSLSSKYGVDIYDERNDQFLEKNYKLQHRDDDYIYGDNKNKILLVLRESRLSNIL